MFQEDNYKDAASIYLFYYYKLEAVKVHVVAKIFSDLPPMFSHATMVIQEYSFSV
jgi:hypothetical protein